MRPAFTTPEDQVGANRVPTAFLAAIRPAFRTPEDEDNRQRRAVPAQSRNEAGIQDARGRVRVRYPG